MTFNDFMHEMHGLTLVHWDPARGLACFWNGSVMFLEFRIVDGLVEHGDSWSARQRILTPRDALDMARGHYGLSTT